MLFVCEHAHGMELTVQIPLVTTEKVRLAEGDSVTRALQLTQTGLRERFIHAAFGLACCVFGSAL